MQSVTAHPSPAMLQRVDRAETHDVRKRENATQSTFASYAFGPMDLQKGESKSARKEETGVSGIGLGKNPLGAASLSFITSTQEVGSADQGGDGKLGR